MAQTTNKFSVYLEVGKKKTFAGALEWPGWCRSGRDADAALRALCDYGPRYASVLGPARLEFKAPADPSAFAVIERLEGDATTDFGAPGKHPTSDARPVDEAELQRFQMLLQACWQAFDTAARVAMGKELRKGPRGGGRDLDRIIQHVLDADAAYLKSLGWKFKQSGGGSQEEQLRQLRKAILEGLVSAAHGELPTKGPRGSIYWSPRYFVRRAAWHVLDHAWELEDRIH